MCGGRREADRIEKRTAANRQNIRMPINAGSIKGLPDPANQRIIGLHQLAAWQHRSSAANQIQVLHVGLHGSDQVRPERGHRLLDKCDCAMPAAVAEQIRQLRILRREGVAREDNPVL